MEQTGRRPRILYVDDAPQMRVLVRRLLSPAYEVLEAGGGLEGIERARETRPDLVLVDLHMPQLTGYEVATRIRSLLPEVPIVALTADVSDHVRERALASGCSGYISKPIDPDAFPDQVAAFLAGRREVLEDDSFRNAYQQTLVARLEEKVRELSAALERNAELNARNLQLLESAERRARLLEAGARIGRSITSILDLDQLLKATVDLICDEFDFYYAGVFLLDEEGEWAVLHAGRGEAGAAMLALGHRLPVEGRSMIGTAIRTRAARIALDVGEEPARFQNPHLPETRSEMALPLLVGEEVIGALTVQSAEEAAFSHDDVTALQAMADQLAVAINNARLLRDLEAAHAELMRFRSYEAIATATGEAIHWVGNKAAPIPGSVARITEDVVRYLALVDGLLAEASPELRAHPSAQLLLAAAEELREQGFDLAALRTDLMSVSLKRLKRMLNVDSILEDLSIIGNSAQAILNIKEDLIGPVRQQRIETISLPELLMDTVRNMGIPPGVVRTLFGSDLLPVRADRVQLERVFTNLIKNGMEAMEGIEEPKLFLWARRADDPHFDVVDVTDNGVGIPPEQLDRVWMAFFTTKGDRGGTGLGLPACAQIVGQLGGKITVGSDVGLGTTFSVYLPVAGGEEVDDIREERITL